MNLVRYFDNIFILFILDNSTPYYSLDAPKDPFFFFQDLLRFAANSAFKNCFYFKVEIFKNFDF
jgi:hypothetical protein